MNKKPIILLVVVNLMIVAICTLAPWYRSSNHRGNGHRPSAAKELEGQRTNVQNKGSRRLKSVEGVGYQTGATLKEHLKEDMRQCSRAIGVSSGDMDELGEVVERVHSFIEALKGIFPAPGSFSKKYKNPCWEKTTGAGTPYCLPYFFLAGFPKCGTTTLHHALVNHPQIFAPRTKEGHWWTRRLKTSPNSLRSSVSIYLNNFDISKSRQQKERSITYDGSQSYLWDSSFFSKESQLDYCAMPAIISRVLPDAKFIVVMRNPTTRAFSDFLFLCNSHHDDTWPPAMKEDPARYFHTTLLKVTTLFNNCLKTNSLQRCMSKLRSLSYGCGYIGERLSIGLYYAHLHKWMQFYPRENFLFLRTEDISKEPYKLMTKITKFLGIDRVSEKETTEWFSREYNVHEEHPDIDPDKLILRQESKDLLDDFFEPYNKMLSKLAGDSRFLWRDVHVHVAT